MTAGAPDPIADIARAVLYEGYLLYPYRRSALKNRRRLAMGALYPRGWTAGAGAGDPCELATECLIEAPDEQATVRVTLRFLQLAERVDADGEAWHEADEREVTFAARKVAALGGGETDRFWFSAKREKGDGWTRGRATVSGVVETSTTAVAERVFRLRVHVTNTTVFDDGDADAALLRCLASAHLVARVEHAELVSLLEPPPALVEAAAACAQTGVWPVLVGEKGAKDAILASPVILYDYPRIAPESPGDLFDAAEIDEILTLRILTLTDAEKDEMRATDPRGAAILERTERLGPADLARLHGVVRGKGADGSPRPVFALGDRVRVQPRRRADVMDLALAGREATVVAVETDLEGRVHVAVTIDDDPGRDLGRDGQPGHRFFFAADELERLP